VDGQRQEQPAPGADAAVPGTLWAQYCFDVQQAAEKALKALHIHRGIAFRRTHDIEELFLGVERSGVGIPPELRKAEQLSAYAVLTRYPGPEEDVDEARFRDALVQAEAVFAWVEGLVGAGA